MHHDDILRFDIPMYNLLPMHIFQPLQNSPHNQRQPLLSKSLTHTIEQLPSYTCLHEHIYVVVVTKIAVELDYVFVDERRMDF